MKHRDILVWFSCGGASAVALWLALQKYGDRVRAIYCDTSKREHPDNLRFMRDVEKWTGGQIEMGKSLEMPSMDIFDVFRKMRMFRVQVAGGAGCTRMLKKDVRKRYQSYGDTHIFGFTADEAERIERFESRTDVDAEYILQDHGITKDGCLRIIREAGIELPMMYRLGYHNNNCIGCIKGGMGYWNKIRRDFPEVFAEYCRLEREIKASVLNGIYLDELEPNRGIYDEEPSVECGAACEIER